MDFWEVLEEGLWNIHREKKEGLLEINEHFQGIWLYCSSFALGLGFASGGQSSRPKIKYFWLIFILFFLTVFRLCRFIQIIQD